jgi:coenzyme F420-dependent glucose-6-phosphate dehydrogenase
MLEEAIEVIRLLWRGGLESHRGRYFTVDHARIYSLPDQPPPILIAASGERAAKMAGRLGDGLVSVAPNAKLVEMFEEAGGAGKPRYGQLTVCWAKDEAGARRTAREWWPNTALPGAIFTELMLPSHFEELTSLVTEEMVAQKIICGPDPEKHTTAINKYIAAGHDHVYIHQVGPDQESFFKFYSREVLPNLPLSGYARKLA